MAREITVDYNPTPRQRIFHTTTANTVLYGGAAGGGKELDITTPIPTARGFVRMGEISVGDLVFGLDGKTHKVLTCSPIREHVGYRFVFDDGSEIVCNDEHLWFTYTASDMQKLERRTDEYRARRRFTRPSKATYRKGVKFAQAIAERNRKYRTAVSDEPIGSVKSAQEIVETLRTKSGRSNHAIPVAKALELPEKTLPLDPYLLGLWLGDGTSTSGSFTSADGLEKAFADAGFKATKWKHKYMYGIEGLKRVLCDMGLNGNKHIPFEYLWAAEWQRLALLQGLMDTDGNCNRNGTAEFTNMNKQLIDGAAFLIRSLGMKCRVTAGRAKLNGIDCGEKYRIKFTPTVPVFRLERKLERQKHEFRPTLKYRYLVKAERVEQTRMRCISIDSEDHLYLAGENLVPTHNSFCIVMDAYMRALRTPGFTGVIVRRTYPELEQNDIAIAQKEYSRELCKYNSTRHEYTFTNGSKIIFRHCNSSADIYTFQGLQLDAVYFDELTQFTYEMYDYITTRARTVKGKSIFPIVRAGSNPGGLGHGWVKAMFVDAGEYGKLIPKKVYSKAINKTRVVTTQYIPSLVTDNPYIGEEYIFQLEQKPEALRKALLYGNWDAFEGQVFTEWKDDPAHYRDRLFTHVIEPFEIPLNWPRYMSFDHGYTKPFSCGWWAIGPDGCAYRYREWYGWNGTPNKGMCISPKQIAEGIVARESEEERDCVKVLRVADPAIFDMSRGESVAMQMEPYNSQTGGRGVGVFFEKGDNTRMAGLMQIHERLRFNDEGRPRMQVFNTCKNFIRTIPTLPYSLKKPEDVDSDAEDHCLTGDTLVLTDKGWTQIQDMPVSGFVFGHDGEKHRYADCRMTQKQVDVFRITLEDGRTVMATLNHRFMVSDDTWKKLGELKVGDKLKEVTL